MLKVRCSSLGLLMTEPKSKTEILSVGAKTYVEEAAKEFVYNYAASPSSKAMEKGTIVEPQAIELFNAVFFTSHVKNTERRENAWLTGECDIAARDEIIDIKSSWSLATFPATRASAECKLYEWQVRGYMMLWDKPRARVAHCMVSTPEELIGYESDTLHLVEHIDPMLRVTVNRYDRCLEKEVLIKTKVEAAQRYFNQVIDQIAEEHA